MNLHFLLRYSDKITQVDTLQEHMEILKGTGKVIFGKFGIGVSNRVIDIATSQIENGICTLLHLYRGKNCVGVFKLFAIKRKLRKNDERYVPYYYKDGLCSVWFYISDALDFDNYSLGKLRLYNNPTLKPQLSGMRSLIYVTIESDNGGVERSEIATEKEVHIDMHKLYNGGLFD
ncbi:hypothetical protein OB952_22310 [Aeromonas salmonicida]|uniref:hypothetical protein n=1 Tax=Aeromonas salmonicida TaxID=645 RepID=UPI00259F6334|nr:hypothetical protein [Aeromonas salmonicida]MDM5070065.1 hypothetical protein [Aeromonas salmonicida]